MTYLHSTTTDNDVEADHHLSVAQSNNSSFQAAETKPVLQPKDGDVIQRAAASASAKASEDKDETYMSYLEKWMAVAKKLAKSSDLDTETHNACMVEMVELTSSVYWKLLKRAKRHGSQQTLGAFLVAMQHLGCHAAAGGTLVLSINAVIQANSEEV